MTTICIRLSENTVQHLQEMAGRESSVSTLCKELIENAVADRRRDKRLQMFESHYTARNADDYSDVE